MSSYNSKRDASWFGKVSMVFIKRRRRLSTSSKQQGGLNLNAGVILSSLSLVTLFVLVAILILVLLLNPPWHEKTETVKKNSEWKTASFTDKVSIRYREVNVNQDISFSSVAMISPQNGWVVGSGGTVFKYSNDTWRRVDGVPEGIDLDSVSAVNENDVWFTGTEDQHIKQGDNSLFKFWILHYDGQEISEIGSWPITQPGSNTGTTIVMTAKDDGWAGSYSGLLLHYDGKNWNHVENGDDAVWCLAFENANKGWRVGENLYVYNNGQWTQEGPELDDNYDIVLPLHDGSVMLASGNIVSDERDGKDRQLNVPARVENGRLQNISGFEQRYIDGIALGPQGYVVVIGRKDGTYNDAIMLYQNGRKVGGDINMPEDTTRGGFSFKTPKTFGISFDSENHGWICLDTGDMIEFTLRISKL